MDGLARRGAPSILAERYGIGREAQDEFAAAQPPAADAAWDAGAYDAEVVPVPGTDLERDESIRAGLDAEGAGQAQAGLPHRRHGHGGQLLPAERRGQPRCCSATRTGPTGRRSRAAGPDRVARRQRRRTGRLRDRAGARRPARRCERAGIGWGDLAPVELNEAFAAQSLACLAAWPGLDPEMREPARRRDRHRPPARRLGRARARHLAHSCARAAAGAAWPPCASVSARASRSSCTPDRHVPTPGRHRTPTRPDISAAIAPDRCRRRALGSLPTPAPRLRHGASERLRQRPRGGWYMHHYRTIAGVGAAALASALLISPVAQADAGGGPGRDEAGERDVERRAQLRPDAALAARDAQLVRPDLPRAARAGRLLRQAHRQVRPGHGGRRAARHPRLPEPDAQGLGPTAASGHGEERANAAATAASTQRRPARPRTAPPRSPPRRPRAPRLAVLGGTERATGLAGDRPRPRRQRRGPWSTPDRQGARPSAAWSSTRAGRAASSPPTRSPGCTTRASPTRTTRTRPC